MSTVVTADGIVREYAEPDTPTLCGRCYEPVYFVVGLIGPARWKHVRTDDHECSPICQQCGHKAEHKVYKYGQFTHWECQNCSEKILRIERT